jgi:putative ABC transport system permease protein
VSVGRWSRRLYGWLLRVYPADFRERFRHDLEADFGELVATHGRAAAWRRVLRDLARSLRTTHVDAQVERQRLAHLDPTGDSQISTFLFDVRHAARALLRAPVFTIVTVATLALGIGANSAIFSLVNAVLLRPIGYPDADRLLLIYEGLPETGISRPFGVSPPDYADLEAMQQSFKQIGAYRSREFELSGVGDPRRVTISQVTPSVFSVLGVPPASGRTLVDGDANGDRLVVISHGLAERAFAGRSPIGERLILDREPYAIVGVMPASFEFPKRGPQLNGDPADAWTPLVFNPFERQARGMFYNHTVIGRLNDGTTPQQAAAEMTRLGPQIRERYPARLRNSPISLVVFGSPLPDEIAGRVRRALLLLLGAVGLVLLVACANVANLILARAVVSQREIGLRMALGAARYRLFQMLLAESVLLASAAGAAGLLLGYWVVRAMPAVIATSLPGVANVSLDARVVIFTMAISVATALGFSLVPFAVSGRRDLNDALREGAARTAGGASQHRVQASLVVASVALAFVLLVGAGLLGRSLTHLLAVEDGVHADNVLTFRVALPYAGYRSAGAVRAFYLGLQEKLRAIPGVRSASISSDLPLDGDGERRAATPEHVGDVGGQPPSMAVTWIHGSYFDTYGIPVVRGRSFSREEEVEPRPVAIVSRALAARFWPGEDPIGKQVKWGLADSESPWRTVIGTVGDVVDGPLGEDQILHVYVPYSEVPDGALGARVAGLLRQMVIGIRSGADARLVVGPARAAVASIDPAMAISDVTTMTQVEREATAPQRFSATVLAGFAAGGLLLAGVGLYGVLAFGVTQRTREIGVRLALGAKHSEVLGLVVRQGIKLTAIGLLIGLAGAVAASRFLGSLLYETPALDLRTFALVPVVLAVVALIACYVPGRRAARIDPMAALRAE